MFKKRIFLCLLSLPLVCISGQAKDIQNIRPLSRASELAGQLFIDESVFVTGAIKDEKYFDLAGVSTPTAPTSPRLRVFVSSVTSNGSQLCQENSAGGVSCLNTNTSGFILGTVVQSVQFVDTAQSASSGANSYTATTTAATITPKSTTHKIRISVNASSLGGSSTAGDQVAVTIERGVVDLAATANGFAQYINAVVGNVSPCAFVYLDSPATTSSVTYTVFIKNVTANRGVAWNNLSQTATILLEEIAY